LASIRASIARAVSELAVDPLVDRERAVSERASIRVSIARAVSERASIRVSIVSAVSERASIRVSIVSAPFQNWPSIRRVDRGRAVRSSRRSARRS